MKSQSNAAWPRSEYVPFWRLARPQRAGGSLLAKLTDVDILVGHWIVWPIVMAEEAVAVVLAGLALVLIVRSRRRSVLTGV